MFLVESSVSVHVCPKCHRLIHYRDSRKRIFRREGGEVSWLLIRRFYCPDCHCHHTELPDCLAPYKHYGTETISGVIDGVVTPNDSDSEDYPSFQTMRRWLQWFRMNLERMEGYLRNTGYSVLGLGRDFLFSKDSLLEAIRKQHQNWLEIVLRAIYNGGGFLPAIPW